MKRIFECILFIFVCLMLVCTSFFVGKTDSQVNEKVKVFENVVIKALLFVEGTIVVGKQGVDAVDVVIIDANMNSTAIVLYNRRNPVVGTHDASVMFVSATDDNGRPKALVNLSDKFNNVATGSNVSGWFKE